MTFDLLLRMTLLFVVLFVVGSLACLPAYHWDTRRFLASKLWLKIRWWWPIYAGFCVVLYGRAWVAWAVVIALLILALREIRQRGGTRHAYVWAYYVLYAAALLHLPLLFLRLDPTTAVHGLIAVCFGSVLSDVCAFFAGTYIGEHALPRSINPHKSYEGVAGQIAGAWLGVALVAVLPEIGFSWWLAIGVGVASAAGDIVNSIVKRLLDITDWGDTIPGHGGVLDRFASLSFAIAVGCWVLLLR